MSRPSINPSAHGVVPFTADGQSWRLVVSMNALCLIEARVSDAEEVTKLLTGADASFATVRTAFWAALSDHHPDLTPEDVGRILDHVGLQKAGALLATALMSSLLMVEPGAENPRVARRVKPVGTGTSFSANGSSWISRLMDSGFKRRAA